MTAPLTPHKIAIVGGGPRGLTVLNEIAARFEGHLDITVFDPWGPGGRVWHPEQPIDLVMNTTAGRTSLYADWHDPRDLRHGPSFGQWAQLVNRGEIAQPHLDDTARRAIGEISADSYAPRALYGHYLQWAFRRLIAQLPESLSVALVRSAVLDLSEDETGITLCTDSDRSSADAVVLAPGHVAAQPNRAVAGSRLHMEPGHPAELRVNEIAAGATVLIRGLALNFYDVVTLLTSARGGRYERLQDGALSYRRSGREPVILAGSRRGVPSAARVDNHLIPYEFEFLTHDAVHALMVAPHRPDFRTDVWPLVVRELENAYRLRGQVDPLEMESLLQPLADVHSVDQPDLDQWFDRYLECDWRRAAAAVAGDVDARAMAALVLRRARTVLRPLIVSGGVSGFSYLEDVRGWFDGACAHLSHGPPWTRVAELQALIRAGVVHLVGAGLRPGDNGEWLTDSRREPIRCDVVVDAYMPEQDLRRTDDPLLDRLVRAGTLRNHIRGPDGATIGAVDVDVRVNRVVNADGRCDLPVWIAGPVLEGVRWTTGLSGQVGDPNGFVAELACLAADVCATLTANHRDEQRDD